MSSIRKIRRGFRHTQEEYVIARMKSLEKEAKSGSDTEHTGNVGEEGVVRPKRFDKFNPDGEFPVATKVPAGVLALAKQMQLDKQGEQDGAGSEVAPEPPGLLPGDREGEDQDKAGA